MKRYKHRKTFTFEGKRYNVFTDSDDPVVLGQLIEKKKQKLISGSNRPTSSMPLHEWAYQCVETYKTNQKEITRKKYIDRMNTCILKLIGQMPLNRIRPIDCQQVLNRQAGRSKTQINEVYQTLRFLFKHAKENGLIDADPTEFLVRPQGTKHHRRALTAEERATVLAVGQTDRRYYIFLLMLLCGCRPSEAEECKGYDIITKDGTNLLHIRGTKTAQSDRFVPIPDILYDLIKDTLPEEYIACTSTGAKIGENRRRIWKSFVRQMNIYLGCKMYRNELIPPYPVADDLVPYCLRHEYCTNLARLGVDIRVAQKLMGHASIKMTAEIYTHIDDSMLQDVAQKLNGSHTGSHTG